MPYEMIQTRGRLAGRLIETGTLFVLLTVIGLRPLIGEGYDLAGVGLTAALAGISDPLPLYTLLIDVTILAAVFGWAVSKGLNPSRRYRWCGLEVGLALVVVAAVVSCLAADDKRVAINASVDWVSTAAIAVVLTQLLRERGEVRLALCVIAASAAAQAYQCFDQVFVGFAETERMYYEGREALWKAQDVLLDSPQVALFEGRMKAREASGYLAHSNIAGAYLLVTFFAMLGVIAGRWRRGAGLVEWALLVVPAVVGLFLLAAMVLTHSLGALAACAAGLVLWAVWYVARKWIAAHRGQALGFGWAVVIGGVLAVVAHGLYHKSLPGSSLDFRWGYWTASARLIADHPWTGVGRENFGDAYLKYKPITSPEEVKNPHNLLVGAASEWGVVGLAGVLAMMVGGSIVATRRLPEVCPKSAGGGTVVPTAGHPRLWMLFLVVSIFWSRLNLLGSEDANYLYVATVLPAIVWLVGFAVYAFGPDPWEHAGRDGWLRMAVLINCGLFAFLLQDAINFALIVPATATTFFALVGVSVAARRVPPPRREHAQEGRSGRWRWGIAVVTGLVLVAVVVFLLLPVWRATSLVVKARANRAMAVDGPIEHHPANLFYLAAMRADMLDPTAAAERAEWLQRAAGSSADPVSVLREARSSIDEAIARRPGHVPYHRRRTMISLSLAQLTNDPRDRAEALASAERAIELYPTRPASYVDLANLLLWAGHTEGRSDLVEDAVENFRYALDLDGRRPAWEEIRRFRPAKVEAIQSQIAEAQAWLAGREREGAE